MKKYRMILSALTAVTSISALPALAIQGPEKVFDATYTVTTPQGNSTMRMISDGKGHLRTESSTQGFHSVSIMDYPAKEQISLIEQGKMAMKTKLPETASFVTDAKSAKQVNAKDIGSKVVDGHPCHGFKYDSTGASSEVWTADDLGFMVLSTSTTAAGKIVTHLKTFTKNAPPATAFEIPAGYKLMAH